MCEECNTSHDRTGRLVVAGQSNPLFVPNVMKIHIPLTDDPAQEEDLLQDTSNELKSCHDKTEWSNFVLMQDSWPQLKSDSISWQKTLKNSHNLQIQWPVVSTLCQKRKLIWTKRWVRGSTKIGPELEVTTCCLQCKYGVEIRIESFNKDHSHSWVRISHGLKKLVANLNIKEQDDNEQETSEMQFENYAVESNARAFAGRSKAKAKPQRTYFCQLIHKNYACWGKNLDRYWTTRLFAHRLSSVDETDQSSSSWLSTSRRWWSDWILEIERLSSAPFCAFSALVWWKVEEQHGRRRRILYLQALQGHSGRSLIDPWLQNNVLIPDDFFEYVYHFGCANNLHSIINSGLIPGSQKFEQKTDSILSACESWGQWTQRSWENRLASTASCTIHTDSVEETSKHGVLGRHQTCSKKKGLKFYQTRSNAIILYNTRPVYCIPKAIKMETGEIMYEKVFESPLPPPKISLRNNWMKEVGSEVARQAESSQPNPNPIHRTGRPVWDRTNVPFECSGNR